MFDEDGNPIKTPIIDSVARYLQLKDFEGDEEAANNRWMDGYEPDDYKEAYRKDARAIINILLAEALTPEDRGKLAAASIHPVKPD